MKHGVCLLFAALPLASCDALKSNCNASAAGPAVGRYVIFHSPHVESDTMLLDSVTGKTWQLVTLGKDKGMGWQFTGKTDESDVPIEDAPKNSN